MSDDARYLAYVRERGPRLRRTAYLLCGDWHRAEDAVQKVFVALYLRPPRAWEAVDSWVQTSLVRALIDESRRPWRRERSSDSLPDLPTPEHRSDERLDVVRALSELPRQQRAVVVLRFWDDLSVRDTAATLGISEGAVKSHTSRGLAALRTTLERTTG